MIQQNTFTESHILGFFEIVKLVIFVKWFFEEKLRNLPSKICCVENLHSFV